MDLNVKCLTMKLLEENIRENLCNFELGDECLKLTPKMQSVEEEKVDKLYFKMFALWKTLL